MEMRKVPNPAKLGPSMTDQQDQPIVPAQYAGKWIAWTSDGTRIAGAGDTPEEAAA